MGHFGIWKQDILHFVAYLNQPRREDFVCFNLLAVCSLECPIPSLEWREGGSGCCWGVYVGEDAGIAGHHSNLRCLSDSENISLNIYIYITVYSFPPRTHTTLMQSPYLLLFSIHRWPPHMLKMAGREAVTSQEESVTSRYKFVQMSILLFPDVQLWTALDEAVAIVPCLKVQRKNK